MAKWDEITKEDVIKVAERFINEKPDYPEPRSTFLIYKDKRLPAKHIRGMAYKEHFAREISKSEYSGGLETARFFNRLGFAVDYRGKTSELNANNKKNSNNIPVAKCSALKPSAESNKAKSVSKITIPSKNVIEQKNALQLILNDMFDGDVVCEKTYPWLKTPSKIEGDYKKLIDALSAYRGNTGFARKNVALRCDFVCEGKKTIIEYDERQHFSLARKAALESYRDIPLLFDRELWIKACEDVGAKDNYPPDRDEVRAYYDGVRDISCFKNGYKLIRIMHGQIDFEAPDAYDKLEKLLNERPKSEITLSNNNVSRCPDREDKSSELKVAMYLQTEDRKNKLSFDRMLTVIKKADADLIVFPEYCYVPFVLKISNTDLTAEEDIEMIYQKCLELSEKIGKAIIIGSHDRKEAIFSVYANAFCSPGETQTSIYIKHTMCETSCMDFDCYRDKVRQWFSPILIKGYKLGMTICYDCNHALFSRMYGMQNVDLIVNSTGGNVIYDKWFKYNKARAIENNCYNLVTMGGEILSDNPNNYVFGFNKNGGILTPVNLCGDSSRQNVPGGLYVYTVSKSAGNAEPDTSNPYETKNKKEHMFFKAGSSDEVLNKCERITSFIYRKAHKSLNVFYFLVENDDILKPEIVQKLLYSKELKRYSNRRYIIINKYGNLDRQFFNEKLSVILKVRAMENFCAVILESDILNKCYQCGKNRTAQVVMADQGVWGIDLERTSGPEAIWKNKIGMKARWRENYEWLVDNSERIVKQLSDSH